MSYYILFIRFNQRLNIINYYILSVLYSFFEYSLPLLNTDIDLLNQSAIKTYCVLRLYL